jgi:hypothetical protein
MADNMSMFGQFNQPNRSHEVRRAGSQCRQKALLPMRILGHKAGPLVPKSGWLNDESLTQKTTGSDIDIWKSPVRG